MQKKPSVAFICTHNSCRSQIAEALGKALADGVFSSFSAGTEIKGEIDADAVRTVKRLYGIDMRLTQRPKTLEELPPADIVVTMGCGVKCPVLSCRYREDWGISDPTGKDSAAFDDAVGVIAEKICDLRSRISKKEI